MAYVINKTDGSVFAVIAEGTVNTDSSVAIVGRNYLEYGEFIGENFITVLENSADVTAPTKPLSGQLWFDTGTGILKVYNGNIWKNLGSAYASDSEPSSSVIGDLWLDTVNEQLKVYDGSAWILVGPSYSSANGISGAIVDVVKDTLDIDHVVVKMYVSGEIVSIISKDATFTPVTAIDGFATINPGIQISTAVNDALLHGTATNAQLLDGIDSTGFLSSTTNDTTTGTLGILNDSGLTIGVNSDLQISISSNNVVVQNTAQDGDISFNVNDGGLQTTALIISGSTHLASVAADPTSNLGIATKQYVDNIAASASAFDIAGDTGTDTVVTGTDTLTFSGTANEIVTAVTDNEVTISLPDDVTIGNDLTVTGTASTGGLAINGQTLTATVNELNVLSGINVSTVELNYLDASTGNIQQQLNTKAPLASPTLTGTPVAPTAAPGTNTTQLATTAFVQDVAGNIQQQLNTKAPLASPTLTGTPVAPTAAPGTNTTQLATTAFVQNVAGSLGTISTQNANNVNITGGTISGINLTATSASLTSPVLAGVPTAPTATAGTNTQQIATTAFVQAATTAFAAGIQAVYPVGSIYINAAVSTSPATLLGFGTWVPFGSGQVMVGVNTSDASFNTLGKTGGTKDAVVVSHTHTGSTNTAGSHTHVLVGNDRGNNSPQLTAPGIWPDDAETASTDLDTIRPAGDHSHSITMNSTGVSGTNANLQPYITVYMWRRTA